MTKNKEHNTEALILEAAKDVFQHKGMDGARMQEIANKAGINKAMLHYYYRSKQKLFEAVFKSAINLMAPKVVEIINTEEHLFDKIRNFTDKYITFISQHSYIPLFIINELRRNPEILKATLDKNFDASVKEKLKKQIEELIQNKEIKPISADQLFLDVISLCVFPVITKPLMTTILDKTNKQYDELINQRKKYVADFIINAIKY